MQIMNTQLLSSLCLVLVCGLASAAPRQCAGEGREQICLLSFGDLWGSHEEYSGRTIRLSGYLVSGLGGLYLYPGMDYFKFQKAAGGIGVEVEGSVFKAARSKMQKAEGGGDWEYSSPCPATVIGTYSDKSAGDFATLGTVSTDGTGLMLATFVEPCSSPEMLLAPGDPH